MSDLSEEVTFVQRSEGSEGGYLEVMSRGAVLAVEGTEGTKALKWLWRPVKQLQSGTGESERR